MKIHYFIFLFGISCASSKITNQGNAPEVKTISSFPVWVDYSKTVPDSVRGFLKVYLQTKGKTILSMKEALELMFENENTNLRSILPDANVTEKEFINKLETLRKPVCNFLKAELFYSEVKGKLLTDSIRWFVLQKPSLDTVRIYHSFYSVPLNVDNPYLIWRDFADTVLASRLLK